MLCLRSRYSLSFVYCHHYHHYYHSNIIFGTSSSKSYFYRGGKSIRERERERQSSQSARMKPILTVYHYELDIPLNHVEETRSVKQSSKFRPNFPPLSRVFSALYLVFTLVSIIDQLDTGPIQVMVSSSSLIKSNEKRKPRKKKKRKTKNKNDPIMNYYIR